MQQINTFIKDHTAEMFRLLESLCRLPAPSHHEEQRAAFCKEWLEAHGATGVYIDKALNVVFPLHCENSREITVLVAHTDTVFPDTEPMPYTDDGQIVRCPGVGDDTASLAVLLMTASYYIESGNIPANGILFVANSCEEGLGNLKGTRQLFADYAGRIGQFISFDSRIGIIHDRCVGSHRYEVEVCTEGGHSWSAFGKKNAIAALCDIVRDIYAINLPQKTGSKVTYNVGHISGGTSVNTIAQSARMLCEYRSDDEELLALMQKEFEGIFRKAQTGEVRVTVKRIGERPCARDVDPQKIDRLRLLCTAVTEEVTKRAVQYTSASTDCNIPLSVGVPAVCIGVYAGGGAHTREEWIEKKSLITGLEIAIKTALRATEA